MMLGGWHSDKILSELKGMKLSATHHKGEFPSNDPLVVREQDHTFTHGLSKQKTVKGVRISCIGVDIFKTVDVPQFKI